MPDLFDFRVVDRGAHDKLLLRCVAVVRRARVHVKSWITTGGGMLSACLSADGPSVEVLKVGSLFKGPMTRSELLFLERAGQGRVKSVQDLRRHWYGQQTNHPRPGS